MSKRRNTSKATFLTPALLLVAVSMLLQVINRWIISHWHSSLTLVVPATFDDYYCFGKPFLDYIRLNTTVQPSEVIVVVSGVPLERIASTKKEIQTWWRAKALLFNEQHSASRNRNIGKRVAKGSIISFFDIDDIPRPDYFEIITEISRNHPEVDGMIFQSTPGNVTSVHSIEFSPINRSQLIAPACNSATRSHLYSDVMTYIGYLAMWDPIQDNKPIRWFCTHTVHRPTFGWMTLRREAAKYFHFNESLSYGEDGQFAYKLLEAGYQFTFWDINAGLYTTGKREFCKISPDLPDAQLFQEDYSE